MRSLQVSCLNTHPHVNGNGRSFPLGAKWEARLAHLHRALSHDQQMVQTCGLFGVHFSAAPASSAKLFRENRTNYQSCKMSSLTLARCFFYSNPLRLCSSLEYVLTHMNHFNSNTAFFHSRSYSHMRVRVKAPPDLNSSPHLTQSCVLRATRLPKEFLKSRTSVHYIITP